MVRGCDVDVGYENLAGAAQGDVQNALVLVVARQPQGRGLGPYRQPDRIERSGCAWWQARG